MERIAHKSHDHREASRWDIEQQVSMTPEERKNPSILNGSRRARIAKGCGRPISDVNRLLDQFREMQKMMKKMAGGGRMGMPSMPGMFGNR